MNWKIALALSALMIMGVAYEGCGGDDCTQAQDHLEACMITQPSGAGSSGMAMTPTCDGEYLCESNCINAHTCVEINGNLPVYTTCVNNCKGK
jgi:hypothetical protein